MSRYVLVLTLVLVGVFGGAVRPASAQQVAFAAPQQGMAQAAIQKSPLFFIENNGQFDAQAHFTLTQGQQTLWFTQDGLWLSRVARPDQAQMQGSQLSALSFSTAAAYAHSDVHLIFQGANPEAHLEGFAPHGTRLSYFKGSNPELWRTAAAWGGVRYVDLYPGLDLEFSGESGVLSLRLIAHTRANLGLMKWVVQGPSDALVQGRELSLETGAGLIRLPLIELQGTRPGAQQAQVERLQPGTPGAHTHAPSFQVTAPFAPTLASQLVAPAEPSGSLVYSTFLGSGTGTSIALTENGTTYVAGTSYAAAFPEDPGDIPPGETEADLDAFVARLAADGSSLEYVAFLGGTQDDVAYALTVAPDGSAVLTGSSLTCLEEGCAFPTTDGAAFATPAGNGDVFVSRLSPNGEALTWSTFLGGSEGDEAYALALGSDGSVTVGGSTYSADFPTTAGAFIQDFRGMVADAYVARLAADGSALAWSTYLGGSQGDSVYALALDGQDNVFLTGSTSSDDFPVSGDAFDGTCSTTNCEMDSDAFVAALQADGSGLRYASFIGGGSEDWGKAIVVDSSGAAYVAGGTWSADLPTTAGAFDTTCGNDGQCDVGSMDLYSDGFVVKVNANGSGLVYASYLGSGLTDDISSLALDPQGRLFAAGYTYSPDFPVLPDGDDTTCGSDGACDNIREGFVVQIAADGAALAYGTFLGGSGWDEVLAIDLNGAGKLALTGLTESPEFPVTENAYNTTPGVSDAFITHILFPGSAADDGNPGGNPQGQEPKGIVFMPFLRH